ncbi:hypothetical protein LA080_002448 [Diaporthe eres]|nr:hypothetical protein LA080_002448 [Diaporthe eres]
MEVRRRTASPDFAAGEAQFFRALRAAFSDIQAQCENEKVSNQRSFERNQQAIQQRIHDLEFKCSDLARRKRELEDAEREAALELQKKRYEEIQDQKAHHELEERRRRKFSALLREVRQGKRKRFPTAKAQALGLGGDQSDHTITGSNKRRALTPRQAEPSPNNWMERQQDWTPERQPQPSKPSVIETARHFNNEGARAQNELLSEVFAHHSVRGTPTTINSPDISAEVQIPTSDAIANQKGVASSPAEQAPDGRTTRPQCSTGLHGNPTTDRDSIGELAGDHRRSEERDNDQSQSITRAAGDALAQQPHCFSRFEPAPPGVLHTNAGHKEPGKDGSSRENGVESPGFGVIDVVDIGLKFPKTSEGSVNAKYPQPLTDSVKAGKPALIEMASRTLEDQNLAAAGSSQNLESIAKQAWDSWQVTGPERVRASPEDATQPRVRTRRKRKLQPKCNRPPQRAFCPQTLELRPAATRQPEDTPGFRRRIFQDGKKVLHVPCPRGRPGKRRELISLDSGKPKRSWKRLDQVLFRKGNPRTSSRAGVPQLQEEEEEMRQAETTLSYVQNPGRDKFGPRPLAAAELTRKTSTKLAKSFQRELANASRGFVAPLVPGVIKDTAGKTVWDIDSYKFLSSDAKCPPTVNEKLWRQGRLTAKQGLFEVVPGIYQLRSLDISNMTIVEGESGIIVVDPLVSCEPAAAGLELYRKHRDPERRRKVDGLVYTHSHTDHFGGAGGILERTEAEAGAAGVPIIAPRGFMEAVMSENLIAGPSMHKRSVYMYGMALPKGPKGHVGSGLGIASSTGTRSLIPPTTHVEKTAETATVSMHNITTLRGAQVRDSKAWAKSLDEAIVLLAEQRDLYLYLHDQTVRLMNLGLNGTEIAEQLKLPPSLENSWHCQGFYGSLSHNVEGIYQRYMTWFDGNPASLWKHTPAAEGARYVECVGGISSLCKKAERYIEKGDLRFAATMLSHAVSAFPSHQISRVLLAKTYERLAYNSENGPWRNFYLTEAQGLRTGTRPGERELFRSPLAETLIVEQWFEILSVQVDSQKAVDNRFVIEVSITDTKEAWRLTVSNGVLNYRQQASGHVVGERPDLSISITTMGLLDVLRGGDIEGVPRAKHHGDLEVLEKLLDIISDRPPEMDVSAGASLVIWLNLTGV